MMSAPTQTQGVINSAVIDELIAIEEGADWEVFVTENMTKEGEWQRPSRTPLWHLKYGFKIRVCTDSI